MYGIYMALTKRYLGFSVLRAAEERVARIFEDFPKVVVGFSAGKDSSVLLHLVADEARRRGRKFGLLFIDLEAQYQHTIEHAMECFSMYKDVVDPYWVCLPIKLRNAVSQFQPHWTCWGPEDKALWVRDPPHQAIVESSFFPWFRPRMEFEEFTEEFGNWYGGGEPTAVLLGIRASESLNRQVTIFNKGKGTWCGLPWTTNMGSYYNAYPIYDWKTEDVWIYSGKYQKAQNKVYDLMHKAGVPLSKQRLCQPYGDSQKQGLWLFQVLEPETWSKVVVRVSGANFGANYAHKQGLMSGEGKLKCPPGHTFESFARALLEGMPPESRRHYVGKITGFLKWWEKKAGFHVQVPISDLDIPTADIYETGEERECRERFPKLRVTKMPTWYRICKTLKTQDWWCTGLGFTQTSSKNMASYIELVKRRHAAWSMT